jgi:hypothetical protein
MCIWYYTVMRRLTTGIRSEQSVVRRLRRRANVTERTCTNLETWHCFGLLMDESPFLSKIGRLHPYWRYSLASNFPLQSVYLEFPKILNTVVYAVHRWPKCRYGAHDRIWNCILLMKILSQCVKWSTICICGQSSRCLQLVKISCKLLSGWNNHREKIRWDSEQRNLNEFFYRTLKYHLSGMKYLQQWFSTAGLHIFAKFARSPRIWWWWLYEIK